jgi:hypothetical protein
MIANSKLDGLHSDFEVHQLNKKLQAQREEEEEMKRIKEKRLAKKLHNPEAILSDRKFRVTPLFDSLLVPQSDLRVPVRVRWCVCVSCCREPCNTRSSGRTPNRNG